MIFLLINHSNYNTGGYLIANNQGTSAGQKLAAVQQSSTKQLDKTEMAEGYGKHLIATKELYSDKGFSPLTEDGQADIRSEERKNNASSVKEKEGMSAGEIDTVKESSDLQKKTQIIDRLISPGTDEVSRKKIHEAFSNSNVDQLEKVANYGTKISTGKLTKGEGQVGAGCYNKATNSVTMNEEEMKDPQKFSHALNHEVLGHAYFAARTFDSGSKVLNTAARIGNTLVSKGLNVDMNKDIRDARGLYHDYRDRVRTDRAVNLKNFSEAIEKYPNKEMTIGELFKMLGEHKLAELNVKEGSMSFPKEKALQAGATLAGVKDLNIKKNENGTVEVSFKDEIKDKKEIGHIIPLTLLTTAVSAFPIGAVPALLAGAAVMGAGKISKTILSTETGSGEREVAMDGFRANINQNKDLFTVTIPGDAKSSKAEWSNYAFKERDIEEYLAEGQGKMNMSPQTREELKQLDPALYNYLLERMK